MIVLSIKCAGRLSGIYNGCKSAEADRPRLNALGGLTYVFTLGGFMTYTSSMLPNFLIIDDFLANPHEVRQQALSLNYDPAFKKGNYPGLLSTNPLPTVALNDTVSKIIGRPVEPAANTSHGHCRVTLSGEKGRSGVHIDPCFYSGILYLSLPEHCKGGTDFFRHRRTGLESVPKSETTLMLSGYNNINTLIDDVVNKDTLQVSRWERTMRAPMRFNRLILFNPWLFHNSGPAFGKSKETGRLVCLLFFAAKTPKA